nr:NUDIX domain-containing protein [Candidatus Paceibacterota bacterium]
YFSDSRGFPGGLIDPKETAEEAARRHLATKACVDPVKVYMEQIYTFSSIDRDPRGRVVAVGYIAYVPWSELSPEEQSDTEHAWWHPADRKTKLAYDHDEMLSVALTRIHSRISYTTLIGKLMPKEFTLTELEKTYEVTLGHELDKRNFRKKILKLDVLKELPRKRTGGRFRPAQLYRFASDKVKDIEVI